MYQWQNLRGRAWTVAGEKAVTGLDYAFVSVCVIPLFPLWPSSLAYPSELIRSMAVSLASTSSKESHGYESATCQHLHLHRIICHYCRAFSQVLIQFLTFRLGLTFSCSFAESSAGGHAPLDNNPSELCRSFLYKKIVPAGHCSHVGSHVTALEVPRRLGSKSSGTSSHSPPPSCFLMLIL